MLHLLAKSGQRADKAAAAANERAGATTTDDASAPSSSSSSSSSSSGSSLISPLSSLSSGLGSLGSSLLHSAAASLSEVTAGVQRGIGTIEAAANKANKEAMDEEEEQERDAADGEEHKAAQPRSKLKTARRGSADGADANELHSSHADADHDAAEAEDDPVPASSSAVTSSSADLVVRRINFLRLLSRCESLAFRHTHAAPGEHPLLAAYSSTPASSYGVNNEQAESFFRFVALMQRELADYFTPPAAAPAGSSARAAAASKSASRSLSRDPKKDLELRRRVAFLSTVAEKESAAYFAAVARIEATAAAAAAQQDQRVFCEEKKGAGGGAFGVSDSAAGRRKRLAHATPLRANRSANAAAGSFAGSSYAALAPGVHSLRSSRVPSGPAAAATSSSTAPVDSWLDDDSLADDDDSSAAELLERSAPPLDPTQEMRAMLFARSAQASAVASSTSRSSSTAASSSSAGPSPEFAAELAQRALLEELHGMTESLKANALQLRSAMRKDSAVLADADSLLDRNLSAIKVENARLKRWASAGCGEMCWNIVLIVTLWAVFIATFLFIKIFPAPKS